jgi:hypothetical protein
MALRSFTMKSRALRKRATVRAITGSPSLIAATLARCANTGAQEL